MFTREQDPDRSITSEVPYVIITCTNVLRLDPPRAGEMTRASDNHGHLKDWFGEILPTNHDCSGADFSQNRSNCGEIHWLNAAFIDKSLRHRRPTAIKHDVLNGQVTEATDARYGESKS